MGNWETRGDSTVQGEVLNATYELVASWMSSGDVGTGLTEGESLRLRATLMKAKGDASWFDPMNEGHRKLLWFFTCDGNMEMVKYMLSLPGIQDPAMPDATTAFSVALAKGNCALIRELLGFYCGNHAARLEERERDFALAREALLEPNVKEKARQALEEALGALAETKPSERPKIMPMQE